jgi:hypothetical protein
MTNESQSPTLNVWTIGSIAIVVYCLTNIFHEGLGHGGACILMGGWPETLNAIFFSYHESNVSLAAQRFISAGGSIVNLLAAGIALALFHYRQPRTDSIQYCLWLFAAVNLLMAFGYFFFSGITGIGDWAKVFEGLAPTIIVRLGLTVVGAALYFIVAPKLLMPRFRGFLNKDLSQELQIRRLVRLPYLIGGVTFVVAGLLNPYSLKLVLISAIAASFGGTSLLAWHPMSHSQNDLSSVNIHGRGVVIKKSIGWIFAGAVTLIIFVGILGRGISF